MNNTFKILSLVFLFHTFHLVLGMEQAAPKEVNAIQTDFLSEPLPSEQEAELFITEVLETQEKFDDFKKQLKSLNIEQDARYFLERINTASYQSLKSSPLIDLGIKKIYMQLYDPLHFEFIRQQVLDFSSQCGVLQAEKLRRLYELTWGVIMLVLAEQNKIQTLKSFVQNLRKTSRFNKQIWDTFFRQNSWLINMPLFVVSLTNEYFMYIPQGKPVTLNTPLMAIASLGMQDVAESFIEQGALIDYQNSLGHSAFIWFLRYKFLDCANTNFTKSSHWVKWFLEHMADINLPSYEGRTVLEDAVVGKKHLLTEYLVMNGADYITKNVSSGQTVLMLASVHNLYHEVNFLLGQGADPEIVDSNGKRPSQLTTDDNVQLLLQGWEEMKENQREMALEEVPCGFSQSDIHDFIFGILEKMVNVPDDKRLRIFLQSTHRSAPTANSLFNNLFNHKLLMYIRKRLSAIKKDCKEIEVLIEVSHWCSDSVVRKKLGDECSIQLSKLLDQIYHKKDFDFEKWAAFIEKNPWLINSPLCYKTEEKTSIETLLVHALNAQCLPCIEFLLNEAKVDTSYPEVSGSTPWMIAESIEDASLRNAIQELLLHYE